MTSVNLNLKSYVLPVIDKEIDLVLNSSFDYDMSSFTAQPLCSLGYTYFFHQSYDNLNKALNKVGSKRETHWIVNNFEPILTEVEKKNELLNGLKKYFDKAKLSDDKLVEPLFLQMWEILMCHNLLAEKTNKINIVSKKTDIIKDSLTCFSDKNFSNSSISYSEKDYNLGVYVNMDFKTILDQEPLYYPTLLKNINSILMNMMNRGNMIISLNDTFTLPTVKLITMLRSIFESVVIHKPYYVRPTSSLKYIICIGLIEKSYKMISKKLEKYVSKVESSEMNHVTDMMSDTIIPKEISKTISYINIKLGVEQHKYENKIISYINSEDSFGDNYRTYSDEQILSTEYFLSSFFPLNKNDYLEILKSVKNKILENSNAINKRMS
jgi:hypothetical protein